MADFFPSLPLNGKYFHTPFDHYNTMTEPVKLDLSKLSIAFTDRSLCARSGTCVGLCPTGAIELDDELYPVIPDPSKCTECGMCARACPGGEVDYEDLTEKTFGHRNDLDNFDGHIQETYVAHSTDDQLRLSGAGGGVITALLWDLLKHGEVDGCIVTRMNPEKPWMGEPFIARTYEELLTSQGSKYSTIPLNAVWQEVREKGGKYAYAALPCQAHGFRKAVAEDPELGKQIHSIVGLFCGGALEPYLVPELLKTKGLHTDDIKDFQFRGGEWPGQIRAILKDGTPRPLHYSNYKDGGYNYFIGLYMPKRCTTCLDGSCEFSDLSVSDAWTRDTQGKYIFKNRSRVIARTDLGVSMLHRAIERGTLVGEDVTKDPNYRTQKMQTQRKGLNAPLRVARWKEKGIAVPIYDRPTPQASAKEKRTERMVSACLAMGQKKWLRYGIIKFLTGRGAIPLIWLRQGLKKRKYAKRAKAAARAKAATKTS